MNNSYIFDSWAVLALIKGEEPAASRVRQILQDTTVHGELVALSLINLGEVFYIVGRARGRRAAQQAVESIKATAIQILPIDESTVLAAAHYKMSYRISYADAFAIVGAKQLNACLVTGDPEIAVLNGIIQVEELKR